VLRAEGIEDSLAAKISAGQHTAWQSRLPDNEAAAKDSADALLAQDGAVWWAPGPTLIVSSAP
jgi:hypothetical protein